MRHWRRRMEEWPPDWRAAMERECRRPQATEEKLLPWLPDWVLGLAVLALLACLGWVGGGVFGRWLVGGR